MGLPKSSPPAIAGAKCFIARMFGEEFSEEFSKQLNKMDLCIVGMALSITSYFQIHDSRIENMLAHIFEYQMPDGGWNCRCKKNTGAVHSSFHTTLNILEGLRCYIESEYAHKRTKILKAEKKALEFLLKHKLFRSDKTGEIINKKFLLFSYPTRWHYDVLRGLDFFQRVDAPVDRRINEAIELLESKRTKEGVWPVQNKHKGTVFFDMEKTGKPSRWNTLRALRVMQWYERKKSNRKNKGLI